MILPRKSFVRARERDLPNSIDGAGEFAYSDKKTVSTHPWPAMRVCWCDWLKSSTSTTVPNHITSSKGP